MDARIEVVGDQITYRQNGKVVRSVDLGEFVRLLTERSDRMALPGAIPEGVRFIQQRDDSTALVIEEKPQVRTLKWIDEKSKVPFGPGARYREVRLAFPFVVLIVVLRGGALTGFQQCFYRRSALRQLDDELLFPNLYNVAKAYKQTCWLCLANMRKDLAPLSWENKVREIRSELWAASFNRSSEMHEGMSYWQAKTQVAADPRVASLAAWEEASREEPTFPLSVERRATGQAVGQTMEGMLSMVSPASSPSSVAELVQLLNLSGRQLRMRKL